MTSIDLLVLFCGPPPAALQVAMPLCTLAIEDVAFGVDGVGEGLVEIADRPPCPEEITENANCDKLQQNRLSTYNLTLFVCIT